MTPAELATAGYVLGVGAAALLFVCVLAWLLERWMGER